jgi:hypothetical protein
VLLRPSRERPAFEPFPACRFLRQAHVGAPYTHTSEAMAGGLSRSP